MHPYRPKPIDTSNIELPASLSNLLEWLAANTHEVWAMQRIKDGWTHGSQRDDSRKTHPSLVPYDQLPEGEKEYDRRTAGETLKVILQLGYAIVEPPQGSNR
jgi:hypothetical protein